MSEFRSLESVTSTGTCPTPNGQPSDRVGDIRDDLQARITALLRDLNI